LFPSPHESCDNCFHRCRTPTTSFSILMGGIPVESAASLSSLSLCNSIVLQMSLARTIGITRSVSRDIINSYTNSSVGTTEPKRGQQLNNSKHNYFTQETNEPVSCQAMPLLHISSFSVPVEQLPPLLRQQRDERGQHLQTAVHQVRQYRAQDSAV